MPGNQRGINAEISRSGLDTPRTGNKSVPMNALRQLVQILGILCVTAGCATVDRARASRSLLLNPNAPEMSRRAPEMFKVRLETGKGNIVIEVHRDWAPHGTDRFYNLVCGGYYDEARFFRV